MKQKSRARRVVRGFTLIELLVTLMILGVLASLVTVVCIRSRANARAVQCMSNQQQISTGLLAHYTHHGAFPTDEPGTDLAVELSEYIPWPEAQRNVALPGVWRCPNDPGDKLKNSYQPYYVQRKDPASSDYFVLGCPRHDDAESCYINTCGVNAASRAKPGKTLINGQEVSPEASVAQRSMSAGVMSFEDGSTATVTSTSPGYTVTALTSFRQESGRLYTIVRVTGEGDTEFTVTPGSKFEVVTPVAIIGVKGTWFIVHTDEDEVEERTDITLKGGAVKVLDRARARKHFLRWENEDEFLRITRTKKPKKDKKDKDADDDD